MNLWQRIKDWLVEPIGRKRGLIKCDICGEWGRPNPNYLVPTFVHITRRGATYLHTEHVVKHMVTKMRRETELSQIAQKEMR